MIAVQGAGPALVRVGTLVAGAAAYGFSIGAVHNWWLARWNLAKFPLLILVTTVVCAMAYHVTAVFLVGRASFATMWDLSLDTFRDTSLMLAALAPVSLFLAMTLEQPTRQALNEYPLFLGLNVAFIAVAGSVALVRRAFALRREYELERARALLLVGAWLAITLFVGGQAAWFLRPYFGIRAMDTTPIIDGANADYRGATNFYEAVLNIVAPPELSGSYWKRK